jgi:hypothetical protein
MAEIDVAGRIAEDDPMEMLETWSPTAPKLPNRFVIVCLASKLMPMEVPMGVKVSLGRRTAPHLNNLHISRDQVLIELKPDSSGRILICMTNVGCACPLSD